MSTSVIRILVVLGSLFGGMVGSFVALTRLVPERTKIILGYQVQAIESLQAENRRQAQIIADLEQKLEQLEGRLHGSERQVA